MALGIAYSTEDRRQLGLVMPLSIAANISLPSLPRFLSPAGMVRRAEERATAEAFRQRLSIRAPSVDTPASSLSGGNQQKVVISKWLETNPKVMILDEPTRGIDVGAKVEVHQLIDDLAARGMAIILISSDLPEVLAMSDRILVMREGRQMAIFDHDEAIPGAGPVGGDGAVRRYRPRRRRHRPRGRGRSDRGDRSLGGRRLARREGALVSDAILRRVRPEQFREVILLVVTVGLLLFFASQIPNYFDPRSVNRLTTGLAITLVVAVGQVLVVLTRNIDLSVSSMVGLTAYVVGTLLTRSQDMPPLVAVVLAMAMGLALGSINGLIVAYGGVPAIIATLGTLALYRVVLVEFSGAKTVTTADLPDWLNDVPSATVLSAGGYDLRLMVAIALLVALLGQLTLRYLPFGRRLYAIGSNPEAARTAGLPVQRTVFTAFAICGALSGLAGFMFLVRFGNITVTAAQGLELQVVAAVVVGGVNIFGGSGSMIGALLGVLLIETLQQSLLRWAGISEFVKDAILGLLILIAVTADTIILGRLREMWVRVRRRDQARAQATLAEERGAVHGA